tara:strand:+ start:1231 stop:1512 length:282 start_codon:yes stop_codon:yes gene_type:complete
MGKVAQAKEKVDMPRAKTLTVRITRTPYRSEAQPTIGEVTAATNPPRLAAPAIKVRLHPKSSEIGNMKTARVRLAAAFRTNMASPAAKRITQP